MEDREVAPYKKKKPSNKSKSANKSKHKHDYEYVLCHYTVSGYSFYVIQRRCRVCGKITSNDDPAYYLSDVIMINGQKFYRHLTQEEILKKYKNLPIVERD